MNAGSNIMELYFTTNGITGAPAMNAPVWNLISCLPLVVVPSGYSASGGHFVGFFARSII